MAVFLYKGSGVDVIVEVKVGAVVSVGFSVGVEEGGPGVTVDPKFGLHANNKSTGRIHNIFKPERISLII